jgi:hypothetical protein
MLRLFLCGDVMTGRGIDQALPYPVNLVLYEPYVRDALALRSLEQTRRAIRHADAPERRQ